jgi:hypothetical protein
MHGGQDTYFVSRDLMRSHKHNLGDLKMGRLFKRWQLARQYSLFGSKAHGTAKVYVSGHWSFSTILFIYTNWYFTYFLAATDISTILAKGRRNLACAVYQ